MSDAKLLAVLTDEEMEPLCFPHCCNSEGEKRELRRVARAQARATARAFIADLRRRARNEAAATDGSVPESVAMYRHFGAATALNAVADDWEAALAAEGGSDG